MEPDIYEVAASSTVNLQKRFYKSYFLGEDEKVAISLCESAEFLAGGGTTGLRTWEAAEVLLDWCWKKKVPTTSVLSGCVISNNLSILDLVQEPEKGT